MLIQEIDSQEQLGPRSRPSFCPAPLWLPQLCSDLSAENGSSCRMTMELAYSTESPLTCPWIVSHHIGDVFYRWYVVIWDLKALGLRPLLSMTKGPRSSI